MSEFSDADRERIRSLATIARVDRILTEPRAPSPAEAAPAPAPPPIEDPMTTWRREAADREARVAEAKRAMRREEENTMRDRILKGEAEQLVIAQKDLIIEAVGAFLGETLEQERNARKLEVAELKAELAKLRTELVELKLSVATAGDRRSALELPNPLSARTRLN
jgi:hypothetical protein